MFYKKYKPTKLIEEFVECYFVWEGEPTEPLHIESPPNSLCSFVFNYENQYRISNHKYKDQLVPLCFIGGQSLGNYTLHIIGKIGLIGIAFKPATIYHLYGIPMYELTDERICFTKICPESGKTLISKLGNTPNSKERIAILENYVLELLNSKCHGTPEIIKSANGIFDSKGQLNIMELLDRVPMSRRNFERKFLEEVGVSPKTYAKLRRFGYTCSLMAGNRDVNLMDVLCEGGYYDQSHFIKDFKYFSGRTPRHYSKTNVELANYVDGITLVEQRLQQEI